jgi:hypothetical protein
MPSGALTPVPRAAEKHRDLWVLQVKRYRSFVAVQILEIRAMARPTGLLAGDVIRQGVDLDVVGAPIGELAHAGRSGAGAGEIEHREAGKGL